MHDILRAAAVLAPKSSLEIALETGIRRSRVERLLAGRAPLRGDEPVRILEACGVDRSLVTTPVAISIVGNAARVMQRRSTRATQLQPADLLLGILLHREIGDGASSLPKTGCDLIIDKLSLTFDVKREQELLDLAATFGTEVQSKKPFYAHEFRCGGVLVQHGHLAESSSLFGRRKMPPFKHRRRSSRLEFNPHKLLGRSHQARSNRFAVRSLLKLARPTTLRVSRLDLAVDVPVSIHRIQALGTERQKASLFLGPRGVETMYFGKQKSDRQLRVYDRRQKLIDEGRGDVGYPQQTRFEAQLRNLASIEDLDKLANPFEQLRLLDLGIASVAPDRRHLIAYARVFGMPLLESQLGRDVYRSVVAELRDAARAAPFPHPRDVFESYWPARLRSLRRILYGARGRR